MKIKVEELKPKKAVIQINDTEPYFVNSLRRCMLADLPKLAVDDVMIYDNNSALFDEIISHRLGMIPIPTDLSVLNFRDECSCEGEGCANCTVRYTLSKEGAGMVYSGDLQPEEKSWAIKEENIPIVELYEDQRLILEVETVLGTGNDHAKWQPVQAASYKMDILLEFDPDDKKKVEKFVKNLPDDLVEIKKDHLELKDEELMPELQYHIDKEEADFINVKKDPHNVVFSFETDGALTAEQALTESLKILKNKYSELKKEIKDL